MYDRDLGFGKKVGLALAGFVLLVGLCFIGTFNGLVSGQNRISATQAQLENVLVRRYNVLKQGAAVITSYSDMQKDVVRSYIAAVAQADRVASKIQTGVAGNDAIAELDKTTSQASQQANQLGLLLTSQRIPATVNPEVWANFQAQIEGNENRVTVERMRYVQAINRQNNRIQGFPGNLIAGNFGFSLTPQYQAAENLVRDLTLEAAS